VTVHPLPLRLAAAPAGPARPLSLGFLSPNNPFDRRSFSGTAFFAARALMAQPGIRLRILGPHRPPRALDRILRRRAAAVDVDALDLDGLDAVVGMVASPLLDRLLSRAPHLPALHVTDATPAFLREAYGWRIPAAADAIETRVAARAAACVYSSAPIAARAAGDLGLPDLSPQVAPFGVNLDRLPEAPPAKGPRTGPELLFVGLDWTRKGGDVAVAALEVLRARGIDARLTVVGRCPERHRGHPAIEVAGFLNKNRPRDARRLAELYARAHLLLLPTRADCTPMVVAEAMAHGTPVLATDTGGIAGQIGGGGAGRVLPPFAAPSDWADAVEEALASDDAYAMMSDAAFDRAGALSWQAWAARVETLARDCLAQKLTTGIATGATRTEASGHTPDLAARA
jgi:glycosyltransferase involved in cell wall biosynthesis